MTEKIISDTYGILKHMSQPVFLVRAGKIVYRNAAAANLLEEGSAEIDRLLGENAEAYRAFDGTGAMGLCLTLGGREYGATVYREDGADVFLASPTPLEASMSADTLSAISRTVRGQLTELFDVASVLFPVLEEQENPHIQKNTARLNRSFYRLLRIAGNLSDVTQFMNGETGLFDERTDLNAFFGELGEKIGSYCEAVGIRFCYDCPETCFYGSIDRQKIERAVLNLISNAMKYTPPGGTISLRVERTERSVMIRVIDDGEGIEPATLSGVFERSENRELPGDPRWGIGLGLRIVRDIARLHGGTVLLHSSPRKGTTAILSFALRSQPCRTSLRSPLMNYDYAGGYSHTAVELADVLPNDVFDTVNIS